MTQAGPGEWPTHVAVKYSCDDETKWITNSVVTGIPNFYLSDDCVIDTLIKDDYGEEFMEEMQSLFIDEFERIRLGNFDEIKESIEQHKGTQAAGLIKYILELSICDEKETDRLMSVGEGKYVDQISWD